jgi:hypothetical protein
MQSDQSVDEDEDSEFYWVRFLKKVFLTLGSSVLAVVPTELTIAWNNVHGVSSFSTLRSVGQLVPFVIDLGQFVSVLYLALRADSHNEANEEEANGKS